MLVLTRKQSEKIRIGDSIVITVLKTKGKGVRLGIEAPADVNILRGEIAFEMPAETNDSRPTTKSVTAPVAASGSLGAAAQSQTAASTRPTKNIAHTDSRPHCWPLEKSLDARQETRFQPTTMPADSSKAMMIARDS